MKVNVSSQSLIGEENGEDSDSLISGVVRCTAMVMHVIHCNHDNLQHLM